MKGRITLSRCRPVMILASLVVAALCVAPVVANARSMGPDDGGYYFVDNESGCPLYQFEDITETGKYWSYRNDWQDDVYKKIPIRFDFTFYGTTYTHVFVGTNGYLTFGAGDWAYENHCLSTADGFPRIAPFFDDLLAAGAPQGVYWEVKGQAPHRRLIVEWYMQYQYSLYWQDGRGTVIVEAILYEGSNEILFMYKDVEFDDLDYDYGLSATVGIGLGNGTTFLEYSCDEASLSNGLAILFGPGPLVHRCQETAVDLASFTATAVAGGVRLDWRTLSEIDNVGFFVLRSNGREGEYTRITGLIPSQGWAAEGADYSYADREAAARRKCFYKLETLDGSGRSTIFGPASASARK